MDNKVFLVALMMMMANYKEGEKIEINGESLAMA